ncbi:stAR-related lipid transfer protein 7, mitochondrial isoform X1 [Rhinatrema bivittatum]|uniref:stAR-related lipid transfer protein 7, mitochondrial isoform X1 n=1 Tax=Rhinatrema bivittatum TaxID=194408 RepID=UPI001128064B|nr:stAR-related lipid transfer protein 7, mitochondrial isoform X1 [Rhinatrema bivittatum]
MLRSVPAAVAALLLRWRRPVGPGLLSLLASHCSFVTGQRLRRAQQIAQLYGNLYTERGRRGLWRRLRARHAGACRLMAALGGVFLWEEARVRDDELHRSAEEMRNMEMLAGMFHSLGAETGQQYVLDPRNTSCTAVSDAFETQGWEIVMEKKHFRLWRRPIEGTHLYQYRVFGSYTDVSPRQFFNVQLDTDYRKKWDALIIKLDVIDRDPITGSEVVHWITHFPYPMYARDYVYVRRYHVDEENNLMVLVSRAVEHPSIPESPEFVRVRTYQSQMVIRPHSSFDANGFDYMLTYSDNPQTVFPRYCVSWMVSSGMPDFLEKLHLASLQATNMELKVKDYIPRLLEGGSDTKPSSERKGEAPRTRGQMEYA